MAATTSSTGHVRKRQYQPSITSFFGNRDTNASTPDLRRGTTSPLSPPLPAETQASLLSVGMRVRKSVPEGYKTHKTVPVQGFPFPSSAPSKLPAASSYSTACTRELTPFCGLHKTGGWAVQSPCSAPAIMQEDEDGVPGLMWSQGSLSSTQSSFMSMSSTPSAPSKKRGYDEEVEEEMDAYFDEPEAAGLFSQQAIPSARPLAKMKGTPAQRGGVRIFGTDDFEEAGFLVPDGMEVDSP